MSVEVDMILAWLRSGPVSESCDDWLDLASAIEAGQHQRWAEDRVGLAEGPKSATLGP